MTASPRPIPMEISLWMEKDIQLPKLDGKASLMPTDTKQNAILNRKFFADMFDLSSRRYRSINRSELDKQNFLQQHQAKAESGMPGLLPYLAQFTPTTSRSIASSRTNLSNIDSLPGSSVPSQVSGAVPYSDSVRKHDKLQPIPPKARSKRQQESMDRINRLAQPRGRPLHSLDHVRSHYLQPITVKDLFGDIDNVSNCTSLRTDKSKTVTKDPRFQQLVETCEDMHVPETKTKTQTVQSIVQSNPSLQDDEGHWQAANQVKTRTAELKKHIQTLNKQFSTLQASVARGVPFNKCTKCSSDSSVCDKIQDRTAND